LAALKERKRGEGFSQAGKEKVKCFKKKNQRFWITQEKTPKKPSGFEREPTQGTDERGRNLDITLVPRGRGIRGGGDPSGAPERVSSREKKNNEERKKKGTAECCC